MTAARHNFEGEQLTVAEIRERVPAISGGAIRTHLAAGRNTAHAMLTFDPAAARRRGSIAAAARARANGTEPTCIRKGTPMNSQRNRIA